jgi:hypothetical protein
MAFVLGSFQVEDYDQWKGMFDEDRVGRRQVASGHQVCQAVDDPNHVFVGIEFSSVEEAKAFRERLLASGVLEAMRIDVDPTVVEVSERVAY